MKKYCLLLAALFAGCASKTPAVNKKLLITGIAPIARLTERIAGSNYTVRYIIPPGVSPHNFALKPSDAAAMERAALIIAIHPGIDGAILRGNPSEKVLTGDGEAKTHGGHSENVHFWLSLVHSKGLAFKIAEILSENSPGEAANFRSNAQTFAEEIDSLGAELKKMAAGKNLSALQQHPAWDFFFEELGIKNLGSVEQFEGDQISAGRLVKVINAIKAQKNPVLIDDAFTAPSPVLTTLQIETKARYFSFSPMLSESNGDDIPSILRSAGTRLLGE